MVITVILAVMTAGHEMFNEMQKKLEKWRSQHAAAVTDAFKQFLKIHTTKIEHYFCSDPCVQ